MRAGADSGQPLRGVPAGGRNFAVAARDGIAMRIDLGVPHGRRQPIEIRGRQLVLGALRASVHLAHRHPQLVGEIQLPEPVGADDMHGQAFTLAGQPEPIAFGANQAFPLEPFQQRQQRPVGGSQGALQRGQGAGLAGRRLAQQVLERVLGLFPAHAPVGVAMAPERYQPDARPERRSRCGHEDDEEQL